MKLRVIGTIETCFPEKFGTPRQGALTPSSWARLKLNTRVCPPGIWEGLDGFSHVWLISWFHLNQNTNQQGKIAPPRLRGGRVGVFASRSPHRPNPIGLSLAKIERVAPYEIELSGLDLVSGTPILDIKPYVPEVDAIAARIPDWLINAPTAAPVVRITPEARHHLANLQLPVPRDRFVALITEVLHADPRPLRFEHWKTFAVALFDFDIKFRCTDGEFEVFSIVSVNPQLAAARRAERASARALQAPPKAPAANRKHRSARPE